MSTANKAIIQKLQNSTIKPAIHHLDTLYSSYQINVTDEQ